MKTLKEQLTEHNSINEGAFFNNVDGVAKYDKGEYFGVLTHKGGYSEYCFLTLQILEKMFERQKNGTSTLNTITSMKLGDVKDITVNRDMDMILFKYK